jgi:hypothetical protein
LYFRNTRSFEEEDEDGSLRQVSVVHEYGEDVNSADQEGRTDASQIAKNQLSEYGKVNHVQNPNGAALADLGKAYVRGPPDSRTVHKIWQEYAHGLNGQEPFREKERRGSKWRQDPIDPTTGKPGSAMRQFWSRRLPLYLFIEMRIVRGDSEAVAVETCRAIVKNYLTGNGNPDWRALSPLLRRVLDQDKIPVITCQKIFNKYLTRNGRPISGIVGGQALVHGPESRTVRDFWQEYAHGVNEQEPLREKEKRGIEWRRDTIDPRTGKRGSTFRDLWSKRRSIYLFIEMRIAMGDSEAVALEICQEIVNHFLTRNGSLNLNELSPLLRGVVIQEKNAVSTCQRIFNVYLARNGRPISGIVDP